MPRIKLRCVLFCVFLCIYFATIQAKTKSLKPVYTVTNAWDKAFQGKVRFKVLKRIDNGWKFRFRFEEHLERFECWSGVLQNADVEEARSDFIVTNTSYNGRVFKFSRMELEFIGYYPPEVEDPKPPPVSIVFQNRLIYRSPELVATTTTPRPAVSTTDIVFVLNRIFQNQQTLSSESTSPTQTIDFANDLIEGYDDDDDDDDKISEDQVNETVNETTSTEKAAYNLNMTNEEINQRNQARNCKNDLLNQRNISKSNTTSNGLNKCPKYIELTSTTKSSKRQTTTQTPTLTGSSTAESSTKRTPTTTRKKPIPIADITTKYDYSKVIQKSLLFYEAQRSGKLPGNKRIRWTMSSALGDEGANGEDLSGGYYDAGDYVKFGFPMAFSVTMLAWGVIEYWDAYEAIGELEYALEALRWGADYFMKAHVSPYELYGQVGDADVEHKTWDRPENIPNRRPAFSINKKKPGSDLAGETSAALSAVAVVMRKASNGQVTGYIGDLVRHAHELYIFARNFQQKYHRSIKEAAKYYKSTNFKDEIAWAAAWLYRATGDEKFLTAAEGQYQNWVLFLYPKHLRFSWDDKRVGLQMLLAQISSIYTRRYEGVVESYCNRLRSSRANRTSRGLVFLSKWSPLRYAGNSAFVCLMAADKGIDAFKNRLWAKQQIHYMLGDTGRSYVVGFGRNFPKQPHHRAASCPPRPQRCGFDRLSTKQPNPHVLHGALVGGPDIKDKYKDIRKNYKQTEVALDYNAGFQGAVAALQYNAMFPNTKVSREHEIWYINRMKKEKSKNETSLNQNEVGKSNSLRGCFLLVLPASLLIFYRLAQFLSNMNSTTG